MNITLFNEITTEEALQKLEAEGAKYAGLYCDMDNDKERRHVKASAAFVGDLIKKVDRVRIDKSKKYKAAVEAEAQSITARLRAANAPYSLLIDDHNAKRAAELAKEKAEQKSQALLIQIEADHNEAIMLDRIRTMDLAEAEQARVENENLMSAAYEEQVRVQVEETTQAAIDKIKADRQAAANMQAEEQAKREANKGHKRAVNCSAIDDLREKAGLSKQDAEKVVSAIARKTISSVSITY